MADLIRAKEPFHFCARHHLSALTGKKASSLRELLELIRQVPGASIYHHTHRFLQQHQFLSPEPPNDFAYWVREVLGEEALGERLASIDVVQVPSIRELREQIAGIIDQYLQENPRAEKKFSNTGSEFAFIRSISFITWTNYYAADLREFAEVLQKITIDSIYFHIFESRLRLEKGTNDFSFWIGTALGEKELARRIEQFDPYTLTLEDLRHKLIHLVKERIAE